MAIEIVVPKLGWTAEEATLVEWKKHDGDMVQPGEVYLLVEGDKSINEVEAFEAGILRLLPGGPKVGETVPVGTLLGYFLKPGETTPWTETQDTSHKTQESTAQPPVHSSQLTAHSPPLPTQHSALKKRISPRARRIAKELGVDLAALAGSGTSGRVVAADVIAAAKQMAEQRSQSTDNRQQTTQPTAPSPQPPASTFRKTIAARMAASAHTAAPVTLHTEADATELVKLRDAVKQDRPSEAPTFNDIFIKLCACALAEHPVMNAAWVGEAVQHNAQINIGLAVQTERGLLVPVLREPVGKSLVTLAAESARMIERARTGTLGAAEMQGGTFTITNLGMFDVDAFTPIINLPECAILGLGRIKPQLVVLDEAAEKTAIRKMMTLSLTFDHRVADGAPAAAFLKRIKQFVEQPYLWLTRL